MRTTIVLLVCIICLFLPGQFLRAQERHSFSISYSPLSLRGLQYHWQSETERREMTIIPGDYGYKAVGYDRSYPGVLMLSYNYHMSEKIKVGMDVGYECVKKKWDLYENPSGPQTVNQQIHSLYFLPGAGYIYVSNPTITFSSVAQAGLSYMWSDFRYSRSRDKEHYTFAAQVWLIDLKYKLGPFSLDGSLGAGSLGFCRLGLGMHF